MAKHEFKKGEVTAAASGALPTERVRELYGAAVRWDSDERFASIRDSNLAEFDAWLAQRDAEVRTATLSAALGVEEMARIISSHRHGSQVAWDEDRRIADALRAAILGGGA